MVPTKAGIARPFISGDGHKPAILVIGRGQFIQMRPEIIGNLKIIALMTSNIQKRLVARKVEIFAGGANADRLATLGVHIAPKMRDRGIANNQRISRGKPCASRIKKL